MPGNSTPIGGMQLPDKPLAMAVEYPYLIVCITARLPVVINLSTNPNAPDPMYKVLPFFHS